MPADRDAATARGCAHPDRCGSDGETCVHPDCRLGKGASAAATVDYAALLAAQGGVCAICKRPPKPGGRRYHTDHDHKTGRFRGLLCFTCNRYILGKYATVAKLRAAADYLERGGVA